MKSLCLKALFLLLILSLPTGLEAGQKPPVMSWSGYGNIRFGDNLETMEKWAGEKGGIEPGTENCYYVNFPGYPEVQFMMINNVLSRVYRLNEQVKNFLNLKIGSSIDEIKRKFRGKACVIGDPQYINQLQDCPVIIFPGDDNSGNFYLFPNKLRTKAFILQEHDGKVVEFSAGLINSVTLKEGCW